MKKWYIVDVVGTGTDEDPQRWACSDVLGLSIEFGAIPTDPNTGVITQAWTLCLLNDEDQILLDGHKGCHQLPDIAHDADVATIDTKTKDDLNILLAEKYETIVTETKESAQTKIDELITTKAKYGDIIDSIGKQCDTSFELIKFVIK